MSGIKELRQRVLAAEERFGLNDAERTAYSERLVVLMNGIEGRIRDQQGEIEQQAATMEQQAAEAAVQQAKIDGQGTAITQQAETIEKLKAACARKDNDNEQLRAMLHSLLQAIESGGRDGLAEAMQELDRKASVLVSTAAADLRAEQLAEQSIEAIEEPQAVTDIAVGPVSIGPLDEVEAAPMDELAAEPEVAVMTGFYEDEDAAVIEAAEAAIAESGSERIEQPAAEEIAAPVAEEIVEPVAIEVSEPIAKVEAEVPLAEESDEPLAEEIEEPVAVTEEPDAEAAASQASADSDDELPGGSLDEIMERVSKLVEETEAAIAVPGPRTPEAAPEAPADSVAEDLIDEIAEQPAELATGTDS